MKTLKTIFCFLLFFVLFSCKKEPQEFTDSPIIEAYVSAGGPVVVNITRQIPFASDVTYSADDINNLTVNVAVDNVNYILKPGGNGIYTDSSLKISEGKRMDLSFTYNKKNVTAYSTIPLAPTGFTESASTYTITRQDTSVHGFGSGGFSFPDPLLLSWNNSDRSYYLVIVENLETVLDPIRSFGTNARPGNRFRKTPTNTETAQIRAQEFQYYGRHRIILFHVLPDYAKLYEANSTSSQNLSNPSTSIVNGYGIFTGLNSDTVFVKVQVP